MKIEENGAPARAPQTKNGNTINDSIAINALQLLRDFALSKLEKYQWDPWLSREHEEYVTHLNNILKECES